MTDFTFLASSEDDGTTNLATDLRLQLLACCVANQQAAGFKNVIDLRQLECPNCRMPGFNTGWGFARYACGAEILPDGTESERCSGFTEKTLDAFAAGEGGPGRPAAITPPVTTA
jgi:hypothetical protein